MGWRDYGQPPQGGGGEKQRGKYTARDFLCPIDHPQAAVAMKYHVPGVGELWIVCDEAARAEVAGDDLPVLGPKDLAYVANGATKEERRALLAERVAIRRPIVRSIIEGFDGRVTSVTLKETASGPGGGESLQPYDITGRGPSRKNSRN